MSDSCSSVIKVAQTRDKSHRRGKACVKKHFVFSLYLNMECGYRKITRSLFICAVMLSDNRHCANEAALSVLSNKWPHKRDEMFTQLLCCIQVTVSGHSALGCAPQQNMKRAYRNVLRGSGCFCLEHVCVRPCMLVCACAV